MKYVVIGSSTTYQMLLKITGFALVVGIVFVYVQVRPHLGKSPENKARLAKMAVSPQYKNGVFENIDFTPTFSEEYTFWKLLKEYIFPVAKRPNPLDSIPSVKTDLTQHFEEPTFIWFGHSSYLLKINGLTILMDPVLSGHASPFSFGVPSFKGSDVYVPSDFPEIDILLLSHDHYDHLDYETVKALQPKVKRVITGLGVGEHLEYWGYPSAKITELDWHETAVLDTGVSLTATPSRHFSGRSLTRNNTLWASYVLQTPTQRIFLGGDSGYGSHFKSIGQQYGPFDWAIIECGQYHTFWKNIHNLPEEIPQVAQELGAQKVIPVHWGKFKLALHDWDESVEIFLKNAGDLPVYTPLIGQPFSLQKPFETTRWWRNIP